MSRKILISVAAALALLPAAAAGAQDEPREVGARRAAVTQKALEDLASPRLELFASERELRSYVRKLREIRQRHHASVRRARVQLAQAGDEEPVEICPPGEPDCLGPPESDGSDVVVTGSRAASSPASGGNPSITNNQKRGVEEGDIVKQIGQYLLVLQDGRIFSIDTRSDGAAGLALADRVNVYRNAAADTWYDEMLVHQDLILVTGYSYEESATELTVFRLGERGRLAHQGTFYISSDDYYDTENYATRLVDGALVIYTPMDLGEIDPNKPIAWPVVRRWVAGEEREAALRRARPLFDARRIYRPVQPALNPAIHTISVCPLGPAAAGRRLDCRTTGIIGPASREFYVSPDHAYLWIMQHPWELTGYAEKPACATGARPEQDETLRSLLFQLPLGRGEAGIIGTRGRPINQFSLETSRGEFRALVTWPALACEGEEPSSLTYFQTSLDRLGQELSDAPGGAYTGMPAIGARVVENRFTDEYLVYGGRKRWSSYPPEGDEDGPAELTSRAVAVPVRSPSRARAFEVPHNVIRTERAGNHIILTGYGGSEGLDVSLVHLGREPRIASTVRVEGRYESEGRSHAFNSLIEVDGSGLMGLPTLGRPEQSGRWWWWSGASDVSYFSVDKAGRLQRLGELLVRKEKDENGEAKTASGYTCEVSCIDWYGNARPVFTGGRIFGLAGTELIEGRIEAGRIAEVRRLDLTAGGSRP